MRVDLNFDAVYWINGQTDENGNNYFVNDEHREVLSFALMWGLFERRVCKGFAGKKSICGSIESINSVRPFQNERYRHFIDFFQEYFSPYTEQEVFRRLALRQNDAYMKPLIRPLLDGVSENLKNDVRGLLSIALRVRNNLFHGSKEIRTIGQQGKLFVVLNQLLSIYMEDVFAVNAIEN